MMKRRWTASDRLSDTPEDIILNEVFPRLPAKSLYRLRSVSKHFFTLTSHPPILGDAFRRRAGGRYVLSFETAVDKVTVFHYSDPDRQSNIYDIRTKPVLYIYVKFINGLACLVQSNHAVVIRNPAIATEHEIQLPPLPINYPDVVKIFTYFCYHPGSNTYKVLRSYVGNGKIEMGFSVFSLGADQSWRNLSDPDLQQAGKSINVCINGVLFCTNFVSKRMEGGVIAAFDVGSERFSSVEYPKELPPERYSRCHLIEAGGLIGVLDSEDILVCGIIRLWTKGPESWVERRIEIPSALVEKFQMGPRLSFTSNGDGEMVVAMAGMSTDGCWVYRLNVEAGRWRRIEMAGVEVRCIFGYFQIDEYVETPLLMPHILNSS